MNLENPWVQFGIHVFVGTMAGGLSDTVAVWMLFNPLRFAGFRLPVADRPYCALFSSEKSASHTVPVRSPRRNWIRFQPTRPFAWKVYW